MNIEFKKSENFSGRFSANEFKLLDDKTREEVTVLGFVSISDVAVTIACLILDLRSIINHCRRIITISIEVRQRNTQKSL